MSREGICKMLQYLPCAAAVFHSNILTEANDSFRKILLKTDSGISCYELNEVLLSLGAGSLKQDVMRGTQDINTEKMNIRIHLAADNHSNDKDLVYLFIEDLTDINFHIREIHRSTSDFLRQVRSGATSVENATSLIVDYPREEVDEEKIALLCEARGELWRLSRSVDILRDISLLKAGIIENELYVDSFDPVAAIHEAEQGIRIFSSAGGMDFDFDIECNDKKITVLGDRTRVVRIIESAMLNSFVYCRKPPVISAEVRETDGDRTSISIIDNGCGILPEELPMVFEYGFRGKDSEKQFKGGLGIELYSARKIVMLMGGNMFIESKPGQGSRLEIVLKDEVGNGR